MALSALRQARLNGCELPACLCSQSACARRVLVLAECLCSQSAAQGRPGVAARLGRLCLRHPGLLGQASAGREQPG